MLSKNLSTTSKRLLGLYNRPTSAGFASKVFDCAVEATKDVQDGDTIVVGGFGICGTPINLLNSLTKHHIKDLTVASNNGGIDEHGIGLMLHRKMIKKLIISYIGGNKELERMFLNGELEVELTPQGTLAEKIRSGGCGIPAFYTPTGVGTTVHLGGTPTMFDNGGKDIVKRSEPKETHWFKGKEYILEETITTDFAFVKAKVADEAGNLIFNKSARNFNPDCAQAGRVTIVEAEEIVKKGDLNPDHIHIPSVYVDRIVQVEDKTNRMECLTISEPGQELQFPGRDAAQVAQCEKIVKRAAQELKDGMYVNLGIGLPTLAPNYVPPEYDITLQCENGILGLGGFPSWDEVDPDLTNASKQTVTTLPGASFFASSQTFGMIRGKHMDVAILGAMEVSETGDLANWIIPGKVVKGMGGAMDLVQGAKKLIVTMKHTQKGKAKIMKQCKIPVTGKNVIDTLITDLAVFQFHPETRQMTLTELAEGVSLEEVRSKTDCDFEVAENIITF